MAMVECRNVVVCLTLSSIRYTVRLVYLASAAKASNLLLQAPPTAHHCFPSNPSLPLSASRSASWMDTQCLAWWLDGRFWVSGTEMAMAGFAQWFDCCSETGCRTSPRLSGSWAPLDDRKRSERLTEGDGRSFIAHSVPVSIAWAFFRDLSSLTDSKALNNANWQWQLPNLRSATSFRASGDVLPKAESY